MSEKHPQRRMPKFFGRVGFEKHSSLYPAAMEGIRTSPFGFERVALGQESAKLSPGSIFGNRIALGPSEEKDIFWASGSTISRLSLGPSPVSAEFVPNYSGKLLLPPPTEREGQSVVVEALNGACKHQTEIQNLCYVAGASQLLYSVDSTGHILANRFEGGEHKQTTALEPSKYPTHEPGWVGVAANKAYPTVAVSARYSDKLVTVYDQERPISHFKCIANPTQVQLLENGMLAMTEQGSYSLWDLRLPSTSFDASAIAQDSPLTKAKIATIGLSGSCVQRVYVSPQILYSLDVRDTKILVAGAERAASVYDLRTGGAEARWGNSLKYDVTRGRFSRSDPSLCYLSGFDNELLVGKTDGSVVLSHFDGPHIESHWLGISNDNQSDHVYGLAQSGHMFICKNLPTLLDTVHAESKAAQEKPAPEGLPEKLPHQRQVKQKKIQPPAAKKPKLEENQ